MIGSELDTELLRRSLPRPARLAMMSVVAVLALLCAGLAAYEWAEVNKLRQRLALDDAKLNERQRAMSARPVAPPYAEDAAQAARLLASPWPARLREIESCQVATVQVTRIQIDATRNDSILMIDSGSPDATQDYLTCLNAGSPNKWAIAQVQATATPNSAAAATAFSVTLRRSE